MQRFVNLKPTNKNILVIHASKPFSQLIETRLGNLLKISAIYHVTPVFYSNLIVNMFAFDDNV